MDESKTYAPIDPYEKAKTLGLAVIEPAENELFIDIDSEEDFALFKKHVAVIAPYVKSWRATPSNSGLPKRHVVVVMKLTLTPTGRVAWQAALGSDRMRELLSLRHILSGHERPATLFFERVEDKWP